MALLQALSRWAVLAAAALLAACATVEPGMTRDEVLARWGQPTRVLPLHGGERWQYAYQPYGQQTMMVDLDASGRVLQARQVLNEADFARISTQGDWTGADIEREFGPPASVDRVASWDGPILTYRWRGGMVDQMFYVYLDRAGVVRRAHAGMDPRQFRNDRR